MLHDSSRLAAELEPGLQPAPAQLPVLGRPERLVESAQPSQGFCGKGEVVGREEALAAVSHTIVRRNEVDDHLGGVGIRVRSCAVDGRTATRAWRRGRDAGGQSLDPAGVRDTVIVGEGDDLATGSCQPTIASSRGTPVRHDDATEPQRLDERLEPELLGAAVRDDDGLGIGRKGRRECSQA